ncbi:MAG: dihydrofolate reductase family protein [Chitinophagales bacterium]
MRKIISFMHLSVDGFAAGPNREIDWVHIDNEIFDYAGDQTDHADTALYGRITYELMDAYWPKAADKPGATKHDIQHSTWYNNVEKIVLSRTMKNAGARNTRFISENVPGEISKLKQAAGRNIIMFGSPGTVHYLIQQNLVDEFWLFINPIILGEGITYLQDVKTRMRLKLVSGTTFSSGVVCLQYIKV